MAQQDEAENAILPDIDSSMCYFINKDVTSGIKFTMAVFMVLTSTVTFFSPWIFDQIINCPTFHTSSKRLTKNKPVRTC